MKEYEFLDKVTSQIKYKTIHREIRDEISSHIDELAEDYKELYGSNAYEMAVAKMGNPHELGKLIDKQYRMPFNSRFGLIFWSMLNTVLAFFIYPFWELAYSRRSSVVFCAAAVIILYCVLNMLYLRRGHFKISFADWRDIAIGTLIGTALCLAYFLPMSNLWCYGYYPYGARCAIPYKWVPPYRMPIGFFLFWLWWIIYMFSTGKPKWSKGDRGIRPFMIYWSGITDYDSGDDFNYFGERIKKKQE